MRNEDIGWCRRWISLGVLTAVLLLGPAVSFSGGNVVARIGDVEITEVELEEALLQLVPQGIYHSGIDRSDSEEYRTKALDALIEVELLAREAEKRGIKAPEEAISSVIDENTRKFGSEKEMKKAMEERGYTMEGLRKRIGRFEAARTLALELLSASRYSEDELRKYYEENRPKFRKPETVFLSGILIKVDPSATEEVWQQKKKVAEDLLARIRGGEDFGAIAYKYSEDSYRFTSGSIGQVHRGRLSAPELEKTAFSLGKDEISGVVRTIQGFHILKAGEKTPGELKSFEEVSGKLKRDLEKDRFEESKKSLIGRLKKEYVVEITPWSRSKN
ncbi:MAG: peptidyl-prolyl cis-trans isomerase [Nitrospirae bacterium]|nr:peptidyl-prolyl cis-trans isomerase [Nitrospirota bacterium]